MIDLSKIPFLSKNKKAKIPTVVPLSGFEKLKELISPPGAAFFTDYFQIGDILGRALVVLDYPSYLTSGWLSRLINLNEVFNLALHFTPLETQTVLKQLERQLAKIEAQIAERQEAGKVRSPELTAAYRNVESLRDLLAQAQERMLQIGFYLTIFAKDKKELDVLTSEITKTLESYLITVKSIMFQQKEAFFSTNLLGIDEVKTLYHLNSSTAASFFPFISSDIIDETGIFFGINLQNASLVILNRWAYENPHLVILARSGAGKSYTAKLEVMRNLMMGTDVIILDPENEYKSIAEFYDGAFISLSLHSDEKLNPFDLPPILENEEPLDVYKEHTADLMNFCQLLMGEKLDPEDFSILDQAIHQTYLSFNILPDQNFGEIKSFPTLNDLEKILRSLVGGDKIANRLYPFTKGNFDGFVNRPTTVEINKRLVIFGLKELPEVLRPIGMFIALNYILNKVRREMKRRLVIIDEAWWIMRQPFGAEFLFNVIKRGRKYNLAVTNITQDIEDFLVSPFGKPIITNSAIVLLMKQSPATIDICSQAFVLSEGEKQFLLQAERGEGLLMIGNRRAPIYILASYAEDQIIRSRPEQLIALKKAKESLQ